MASKAELLASARKKGSKQKIYRRGRGTNTSVRQPGVDKTVGREAQAVSDFLGKVLNVGPGILDAHNRETNKENKKLVASGEATYKNAPPIQRKQLREAIRSGTISGGESPYFREGLKRAQADGMALEYGNEVMMAWEKSEAKNSSDPEAFNNFLDEFQHKADGPPGQNRSWEERVGDLGDHVANEEFQPRADAIKRQLRQMHSEHQRSEYKKQARDLIESSEYKKFVDPTMDELMWIGDIDGISAKEKLISDLVTTRQNVLDSKNRVPVNGEAKEKFISNFVNKHTSGPNTNIKGLIKTAEVKFEEEKKGTEASLDHAITTIAGKKVFSVAAFNKESKKQNLEIAKNDTEKYRSGSRVRIDPPLPTDTAQEEMVDMKSFVEDFSGVEGEELNLPPGFQPDMDEPKPPAPAEAVAEYAPLPPADPDISSLPLAQIEIGGKDFSENQVAIVDGELEYIEKPVPQSLEQHIAEDKPDSVETAMAKAIEGINPAKTSYGLVAYNTEGEAQQIVDNIRDNVVGDTTGTWEFAVVKVGDLYQVQTQGGATITDNQHKAFFNALASEYPGEMGNLNARWDGEVKDKDFVQVISPDRTKPKKKKRT